jgi:hypothetical protein
MSTPAPSAFQTGASRMAIPAHFDLPRHEYASASVLAYLPSKLQIRAPAQLSGLDDTFFQLATLV